MVHYLVLQTSLISFTRRLSVIMNQELSQFLHAIFPLPLNVLEEVLAAFTHWEYPKNHYLLKQGRPCSYLYFLKKGAVRYIFTDDNGKENNVWFTFENDVVTDATSFVQQQPAFESIQLLEESELYGIHYDDLSNLLQQHHAFALWYIKLVEQFYIVQIEERVFDLQFLSARERYEKLLEYFPNITNRVSLGHIASYLNITQETLSRIRANKM